MLKQNGQKAPERRLLPNGQHHMTPEGARLQQQLHLTCRQNPYGRALEQQGRAGTSRRYFVDSILRASSDAVHSGGDARRRLLIHDNQLQIYAVHGVTVLCCDLV